MAAVYKSLNKAGGASKPEAPAGVKKNKQRVLILSSRGISHRQRHLLNDLAAFLPHGKKDAKFDSKSKLYQLNELAEMQNCNNIIFAEARKGDLYLHFAKVPNGPTIKTHVQNLHTMMETNFSGNSLRGSRPILSWDSAFDEQPFLQVFKEVWTQMFSVPQLARGSKPFIDRVMGVSYVDGKVWVRNYEIKEVEATDATADEEVDDESAKKAKKAAKGLRGTDVSLLEIGPRLTLTITLIQEGSLGGPLLYRNQEFVSPNQVRAELRRKLASRNNARAEQTVGRLTKKGDLGLRTNGGKKAKPDELDTKMLFA